MKAAICDDELLSAEQLRDILLGNHSYGAVEIYQDPDSFAEEIRNGDRFDIVFMDIEWEREENGIDFASELYQIAPGMLIVFVTGYVKYSQNIFLKPLNLGGFLIKPVEQRDFDSLTEVLAEKLKKEKDTLLLKSGRKSIAIPLRKILYLESERHHTYICTDDDRIQCPERLSELTEKLPDRFEQCHKSYVVNMDAIYRMDGNRITLHNGDQIWISRSREQDFRDRYFHYIGEKKTEERMTSRISRLPYLFRPDGRNVTD